MKRFNFNRGISPKFSGFVRFSVLVLMLTSLMQFSLLDLTEKNVIFIDDSAHPQASALLQTNAEIGDIYAYKYRSNYEAAWANIYYISYQIESTTLSGGRTIIYGNRVQLSESEFNLDPSALTDFSSSNPSVLSNISSDYAADITFQKILPKDIIPSNYTDEILANLRSTYYVPSHYTFTLNVTDAGYGLDITVKNQNDVIVEFERCVYSPTGFMLYDFWRFFNEDSEKYVQYEIEILPAYTTANLSSYSFESYTDSLQIEDYYGSNPLSQTTEIIVVVIIVGVGLAIILLVIRKFRSPKRAPNPNMSYPGQARFSSDQTFRSIPPPKPGFSSDHTFIPPPNTNVEQDSTPAIPAEVLETMNQDLAEINTMVEQKNFKEALDLIESKKSLYQQLNFPMIVSKLNEEKDRINVKFGYESLASEVQAICTEVDRGAKGEAMLKRLEQLRIKASEKGAVKLALKLHQARLKVERIEKQQRQYEILKDLLSLSKRLKIEDIANTLEISRDELFKSLLKWRSIVSNFKIDGDDIVIESQDNLNEFMQLIDSQFKSWEQTEQTKDGKI